MRRSASVGRTGNSAVRRAAAVPASARDRLNSISRSPSADVSPMRHKRVELARVSRVRRRGQQQDASRSDRDRVHGGPARRPERRAVRFVHDEHVPVGFLQRAQHFGLLDEVERRHVDPRQDPGVHIRRQLAAASREPRRAGDRRREAEAIRKLARPLFAEPRGRDDERAKRFPLEGALVEDDARLDRLPEADGVGNHQARNAEADHRQRGFQLIRQDVDGAPGRPLQPAGRMRRTPPPAAARGATGAAGRRGSTEDGAGAAGDRRGPAACGGRRRVPAPRPRGAARRSRQTP